MGLTKAKFYLGQVVHHAELGYRGVIVDIDPTYLGTDEWYEAIVENDSPRDMPWYHVLVDQYDDETYVAEHDLEGDSTGQPIDNPSIEMFFSEFHNGDYKPRHIFN